MSEKPRRVSRIDAFAPIDLLVFIVKDTDLWAFMAVVNVHEWKALKGDLKYDFISEKTGWSTDKVGRVALRARDAGFVDLHDTGHGYKITKKVGAMTWDEYHEMGKADTAKRGISDRKTRLQTPQNAESDTAKRGLANIGTTANDPNEKNERGDPPLRPPSFLKKAEDRKIEEEELKLLDLQKSSIGSAYQKMFKKETGLTADAWRASDLVCYKELTDRGLTDDQLLAALQAFLAPDSWHRQQRHWTFRHYCTNINKYVELSSSSSDATLDARARYYEPWDPRHPYYKPNDPVKLQQQREWEAGNGPWKPKPEWSAGK